MFSLIITIISIALVVALAATTIYYGGAAFREGKAKANAAAINSQGQQILGAAQVFHATRGRWPADVDELVSSTYLSTVPQVPLALLDETSLMSLAYAATTGTWASVQPNVPYYWVHSQVNKAECQQLNLLVRGDNGIFNAAKPSLHTQCFGPAADYTVVIGYPELASTTAMADAITAADPGLWVDETGTGYAVPATTTAPIGGGTGTPAPAAVSPTFGPFNVATKQVGSPAFIIAPPTSTSTGAFSYGSSNTGVASIVGNVVTINAAGTTTISAVQGPAPGFNSGLTTTEFVVTPIPTFAPTYGAFSVPGQMVGNPAFTLMTPTSTSPAPFTYASSNTSVATVSGTTVTILAEGASTITASQVAAPGFTNGSTSAMLSVVPIPLVAPSLGSFSVPSQQIGGPGFALTAPTSNSPGTFSYSSSSPSIASVSGNVVTMVAPGSTNITATQAAAPGYSSASTVATFTVTPLSNPAIGAFSVPAKTLGAAAFAITAPSSNSPGAFTYASSNTGVATVSGSTITLVAAGTTNITATQAAAPGFTSGTTSANFTVSPMPAPTFGAFTIAGKTMGAAAFAITPPTSNSAGAFTYTSSNPGVATVSGNTITLVSAGTTTITANQAAAGGYTSGATATTFTVAPMPTPTFGTFTVPSRQLGTGNFTITAPTSNSGGAFTYSSGNAGVATISGTTVSMVAAGDATITATQAASGGYASGSTSAVFTVNAMSAPSYGTFTVPSRTLGTGSFTVTAPTSTSPAAITYSSSNTAVATVSGTTISMVAAGNTTITASQAASGGYTAGSTAAVFTVASPAAPSLGAFTVPAKATADASFTLTPPSSNSPGAFTYSSGNTSVATISGSTVTIVAAGTSSITATQAASPGFTSASTSADLVVTQSQVAPTMGNFTVASRQNGSAQFFVSAPISNSSGAFSYTSSNTAVAAINSLNGLVTINSEGSTTITATQAATATYTSGSRAATFTVTPKSVPGFTTFTIPAQKLYSKTYTIVPPSSTSTGSWSYASSDPSKVSISGNVATLIANGSPVITATQAAAGVYTSRSTTATLLLQGPVREWYLAYPSNNWYGTCPSPWRQATKDELVEFRANPGVTSFYGGWNWASDAVGSYKVIVNMSDGRISNDLASNSYARMCTK